MSIRSYFSAPLLLALSALAQTGQQAVPTPRSGYPLHVHVIGSMTHVGGRQLVVTIDGQTMLLQSATPTWPLELGEYLARVRKDEVHARDVQRQYTLQLPDGKHEDFDVVGLCERGAIVCFGFSVPPTTPVSLSRQKDVSMKVAA